MIKKSFLGVVWVLLAFEISAQYKDWKYSGAVFIITTSEGADIQASASEDNFPLLIRLDKGNFDFKQAQKNGDDIRFLSCDGNPLCYQIEEWDIVEGKASVWVRIPNIKGDSHQEIKMFWGNPDVFSESNGKSVFNESNGYASVWHLSDSIKDEVGTTKPINEGTISIEGIIGKAKHFEVSKGINCGDEIQTYPFGAAASTTEAWFRTDKQNTTILAWGKEQRQGKIMMNFRSPSHIAIQCYFADVEGKSTLLLNQWNHVVHTYKQDDSKVYINGQLDGESTPLLKIPAPVKMRMGGWGHYEYIGDIDEVRISKVARSADWIKLQYENQRIPQTLVGTLVQRGSDFSVSHAKITIQEGKTIDISAQAGGAQKVYWILKEENEDSMVASDHFSYIFNAGRVAGDTNVTLLFKAVYNNEVKVKKIPILIKEGIPDPIVVLKTPKNWDGRSKLEIIPQITNIDQLKSKDVANLKYQWSAGGIAVCKVIDEEKLTLLRSMKSGDMEIILVVDNGGSKSIISTTITVQEPAKDNWVERISAKDEKPENNQFYARNDKNEGILYYNGVMEENTGPVYIKVFADNVLYAEEKQELSSDNSYSFAIRLNPGLIKYNVEFGTKTNHKEEILDRVWNIVCGDAYIIDGQSNAEANDFGKAVNPYTSDWIRSYGSADSDPEKARLKLWGNAVSYDNQGAKLQIGYWGIELAKKLVEKHKIPICIINGAVGGSRIDVHQRNNSDSQDKETIYGRLLWRIQQAKLTHGIRGIFWYQGENDQGADGPTGHYGWETYISYFIDMAGAWKQDYPNVGHYYVFQIWPKSCSMGINGSDNMLREVQRNLTDYFSNLDVISTLGIKPAGTCHYLPEGYAQIAYMVEPLVERDSYGQVFTKSITSPNLKKAYYTNSNKNEICLEFDQKMQWNNALVNQFYLNGENCQVVSGNASGNGIKLKLNKNSNAKTITYLDSKSWNPDLLLYGENGIAALTFCNVTIFPENVVNISESFGKVIIIE